MIISLPSRTHLAAALAAGPIQRDQPARRTLVLKGAYRLPTPNTNGIRSMVPESTTERAQIAYADDLEPGHQSDVSLRKERSDVVVVGWLAPPAAGSNGMEGSIELAGEVWFSRTTAHSDEPPDEDDPDAERNLFGWQPRHLPPRLIVPEPDKTDPQLPHGYAPGFENFYRRSKDGDPHTPRFTTPGDRNGIALPPNTVVRVRQWVHGAQVEAVDYRLRTPAVLAFTAQLRAWCGHGPDKPRHWRVVGRLPLRCDTLIVRPQDHEALLLWRADWDAHQVAVPSWRQVQIMEGSG